MHHHTKILPCSLRDYRPPARIATPAMFALLLCVTTLPLVGQSRTSVVGKDEPIKLEAFVSTGTRFNDRTVIQSPVPIDIITAAELTQGGYTETSQMLQ